MPVFHERKLKLKHLFVLLLIFIISTIVVDSIRISGYKKIPMKSEANIDCKQDKIYFELRDGVGVAQVAVLILGS